jgi:hypothetical protein
MKIFFVSFKLICEYQVDYTFVLILQSYPGSSWIHSKHKLIIPLVQIVLLDAMDVDEKEGW